MSVQAGIKLSQELPVFGGLKQETISSLLSMASCLIIKKGDILFEEGERSPLMYIIQKGQIGIIKRSDNKQYLLRTLSDGDCVGEMALFDFMEYSFSAYALEDVNLIGISSANLLEVYKQDLEQFTLIQMNIAREVSRRLRYADDNCFKPLVEVTITNKKLQRPDSNPVQRFNAV